jgi:hypothetical protein
MSLEFFSAIVSPHGLFFFLELDCVKRLAMKRITQAQSLIVMKAKTRRSRLQLETTQLIPTV